MIKEIKRLLRKYQEIAKNSEYVNVGEITSDLYRLIGTAQIKRLPKNER